MAPQGGAELTTETLPAFIKTHRLAVVDCWTPWCVPCQVLKSVLRDLEREYAGKVAFGSVDVEANKPIADRYGVSTLPTLLLFKNGEVVDRVEGTAPRGVLVKLIDGHLKS